MSKLTDAYERGLKAGKAAKADIKKWMGFTADWMRKSYPASSHLDYWEEMLKFDRERMQNPPSLTKFPETKGWPDMIARERKGFQEGSGCGPRELAYHFNWFFYCNRPPACRQDLRATINGGLHPRQQGGRPVDGQNPMMFAVRLRIFSRQTRVPMAGERF